MTFLKFVDGPNNNLEKIMNSPKFGFMDGPQTNFHKIMNGPLKGVQREP